MDMAALGAVGLLLALVIILTIGVAMGLLLNKRS